MSTAQTTQMTLASRAGAYLTLTKPDVSLLVLMTTAAGYYMGARGPLDWLRLVHTVFGTMLIAAGTAALNHYIERESDRYMRRTASRPLPSGLLRPMEALPVWRCVGRCRCCGFVDFEWLACVCSWRDYLPELFAGVHAAQEEDGLGDACWSVSRSRAADDWLGGCDWNAGSRRVGAVCDFVFVAVSAFPRDCVDV